MRTIKAAVCRTWGAPLSIEDVLLASPRAGEIEVTLEAVAICHSDILYVDGGWEGALPAVYGHEAAGRVSAVGTGVTGVALGARVVVTLIRACGCCAACAAGKPTACDAPRDLATHPLQTRDGGELHQGMACGAFAQRVVVDQSQVVEIATGIAPEVAALLGCGVITGIGAVVNAAGLRAGQDAVIIGAGGVGLNAIQGARICGARRIVAVDTNADKLAMARAFGATHTVLASAPDPWSEVTRALGGRGADAVFVSVGSAKAYDAAVSYLAPSGQLVMVGMPASGQISHYEAGNLAALGQRMVGSKMGDAVIQRDIPWLVDLYSQGRLKLDELIARRWRFEDINAAIADSKAGAAGRNVIVFD